jgi:hypothetical protein
MKDGLAEEIAGVLAFPPRKPAPQCVQSRQRETVTQALQRRRQELAADVEAEGVRGEADRRAAEV